MAYSLGVFTKAEACLFHRMERLGEVLVSTRAIVLPQAQGPPGGPDPM